MDERHLLEGIGLTDRESRVYLALLELGATTTGAVIKKSGVPSSKVYEVLEGLSGKGLVSYIIRGKTKYFQAAEPGKMLNLLKEKERQLETVLPSLEQRQLKAKEKFTVELFEGIKAIRSMFIDIVKQAKSGDTFYAYTPGGPHLHDPIVANYYKWAGKIREEHGIVQRLVVSKRSRPESRKLEEEYRMSYMGQMRRLMRYYDIFFPGDVGIAGDKIIMHNWENKTAILITSKNLADQFVNFAKDLWEKGEKFHK